MATQAEKITTSKNAGAIRYHVDIDVNSNGTHATILRLAGRNKRVLELGCAGGHMSRLLQENGCDVTAIELDAAAAEHASPFCERVIAGDLDQLDFQEELGEDRFDVVIAADVLEHLKDPATVLGEVRKHLEPDGYVVASIPNVAHLSVRLSLLAGHFPYGDKGLLDRTHLRFFTRESVERLFEDTGFGIGQIQPIEWTPPNPTAFEVPYDPASVPGALAEALSQDAEARTYQFVVVAYPLPRGGLVYIQNRIKTLASELAAAKQNTADLASQLDAARQAHAAEAARSQQMVNALEVQLAESVAREQEAAPASARSQQLIGDLRGQLEALRETSARELAEASAQSEQLAGDLRRQLEEALRLHETEKAEIGQRNGMLLDDLQLEVQSLREYAAAAAGERDSMEEQIHALRDELSAKHALAEEIRLLEDTARLEADTLRVTITEQSAELSRMKARVNALFARERDLREMLLEAHDQLVRRDEEIMAGLATIVRPPAPPAPSPAPAPAQTPAPTVEPAAPSNKYLSYQKLLSNIRELVRSAVTQGSTVLVISKGDEDLLRLEPARGAHFPQDERGVYAGHYPADANAAIAHLEQLRNHGAHYLLIPQTSIWWLEHYREFGDHLNRHATRVIDQPEVCLLFDLGQPPQSNPEPPVAVVIEPVPIEAPSVSPFGVNICGHITSEKGVGEATRATIRALSSAGIPVALNDYRDGTSVNLDSEFTEFSDDNPYAVNLLQANADALSCLVDWKTRTYLRDRYNIGFWFWETATFPKEWWDRFEYLQEIWVATEFVLDAVSRVSPIPVVKVPVALPDRLHMRPRTRAHFGLPADTFLFVFAFDYMSIAQRKNPLGAITAFRKAFRKKDKAMLVLKSGHSHAYPEEARRVAEACGDANIKIIDEVLPREDVNSLMYLADAGVSLHRSEGFGLTMAEMMSLEKPVIATAYSGNMDFMTPANSYLVKYRLAEIGRGCEPYVEGMWAEPDLDHAAELMRRVYKKRDEARSVGIRARKDVLELLNHRRAGALMRDRLLRIAELGKIECPGHIEEPEQPPAESAEKRDLYRRLVRAVAKSVTRHVPSGAQVLVVSKGDDDLLAFSGRQGAHFPQDTTGVYAGHHPGSSAEAIGQLEMLRARGAEYLVFPQTSFWWLEHYGEFRSYLEERGRVLRGDENSIIYDIRQRRKSGKARSKR